RHSSTAPPASRTLSLHDALPIWSREQPRVPPHPVAGAAVSVHPRVWHGGLDRGGTLHQLGAQSAVGRGRGANAAPCLHHRDGERSEEHTSELQSLRHLVCRLPLE